MAAQGLVEALAGNEALPTLAEAEAWPDKFISSTQAHSPNMYSTCILAFHRLETVLAAENSIVSSKYEVEQSLRTQGACREWADKWPTMHADYQQTLLVLWQDLCVEHVPWTIKGMSHKARVCPCADVDPISILLCAFATCIDWHIRTMDDSRG